MRAASSSCRRAGPSTPAMLEQGCDAALFVGQHATRRAPSAACSRTPSARPSGTTCASTARSSARSASTPRCAGPGARRWRSSRATTSCARRRASCSARPARRSRSRPGLGRFSARHLSPARARELLEAAARDALADVGERARSTTPGRPARSGRARHARPRRRLPPPRRRHAHGRRAPIEATRAHVVGRLARGLPLAQQNHRGRTSTEPSSRVSATVTGRQSWSAVDVRGQRELHVRRRERRRRPSPASNCAVEPSSSPNQYPQRSASRACGTTRP